MNVSRNDDFASLTEVLERYLAALPARPRAAVLAVAAPIRGDEVRMMNRAWSFSRADLRGKLGLDSLEVINDFGALAWALPALGPADLAQLGSGSARVGAPKVVLGPGTGLGVASLVATETGWMALPGEGGHATLPAQDAAEEAVIRSAREHFGHCSAERLLSGPGLSFMHAALHGGEPLAPEHIGDALLAGDAAATSTFEMFCRLLATVAGDLALTLGAFGGVYLGGGILPRYLAALSRSGFRERFEAKGRYRDYLSVIPTWVITGANPALTGLLEYARARRLA